MDCSPKDTTESAAHGCWPWLLALGLAAFLAHLPGAAFPFLDQWDDCVYVTASNLAPTWANFKGALTLVTAEVYTPVMTFSVMLDRLLFGLNPAAFHLENQLLHALAALLLFGIARHLGMSRLTAFSVALLWAVHPQRVESVVWITERKDLLAGLFGFGALLLFMRGFDRGRLCWGAAAALLLALGAKPSTVTLPAVMALYALWRRPALPSLRQLAPPTLAAVAYYLLFHTMTRDSLHGALESLPRLALVPLHNACWYLLTGFLPFDLNPLHPRVGQDARTWLVLAAGATAVLTVAWATRRKLFPGGLLFAGAWLCVFLPVSSLLRFNNTDYCDRYNYLLSAVAWLALGALLDRRAQSPARRKLAMPVAAAATVYLLLSWTYLPYWQSSKTLFVRALDGVERPNPRAVTGLGAYGLKQHDPSSLATAGALLLDMAKDSAAIPLPDSLKQPSLWRQTGQFYVGMGLLYEDRPSEALAPLGALETEFRQGALEPLVKDDPFFWGSLAKCYLANGMTQEASRCHREASRHCGANQAELHYSRGMIAYLEHDRDTARREWRASLALRPSPALQRTLESLERELETQAKQ